MGATQVLGGFGIIYGPDGVTALSIVGNAPPTVSSGDGTNAPSALTITGAPGGVASSTSAPQGGLGGGFGVNAGAGGAVTGASGASQGGGGGLQTWAAGNGGDSASTSGTGGIGGVGSFVAGNGGSATAVSGTTHGGQGGNALVGAGNGGVVQSASGVRGSGGHTRVVPGKAATGTGTGGADGHIAMCHDGTSAIGNMGVRNDAPDSAYAIDVTGRIRASAGYQGLLFSDIVVPICALRLTGNQSIATSGADQAVLWGAGTEVKDAFGFHSTSSNTSRITVPSGYDGSYRLYANLQYAANATGLRGVEVYKNGSFDLPRYSNAVFAGAGNDVEVEWIYDLVAGDYLEIWAYQTSGGALNITSNSRVSLTFQSRT